MMKNIVVLISGNGSNLQAIIDACESGKIAAKVKAVFSNKADAHGLERAKLHNIAAHSLDAKHYLDNNGKPNRQAFDAQLMQQIDIYQPDLVILAGYMRILSPEFVQHYQGKMLNIHPSLLPKYAGLNTHQRAIEAGDDVHGTSVHFVTEELDGGPVVLQAKVPIFEGDTEQSLAERVLVQEHYIYPLVAQWFVEERLEMKQQVAYLDGKALGAHGYAED